LTLHSKARDKKIADLRANEEITRQNYCFATQRFSKQLTTQVCLENNISLDNYKETLSKEVPEEIPTLSISESDLEEDSSDEENNSGADEGSTEGEDHFDKENIADNDNNNSPNE
jgi:hypothetical protein